MTDPAATLAASLGDVATGLADLSSLNADMAQAMIGFAKPATPTDTGALAGTVRVDSGPTWAGVVAGGPSVPYAGVIHMGWPARNVKAQPWIADSVTRYAEQLVDVAAGDVEELIQGVRA